MSLEDSSGSVDRPARAPETRLGVFKSVTAGSLLAFAGLGGEVLPTLAVTNGDVKVSRHRTVLLEDGAVVAEVVLVANVLVLVLEITVGALASRVDALLDGLDKLAVPTVDVVGQHALLPVDLAIVEELAVGAEEGFGHAVLASVVQIALLLIGKQAALFGALEFEVGSGKALYKLIVNIIVVLIPLQLGRRSGDRNQATQKQS